MLEIDLMLFVEVDCAPQLKNYSFGRRTNALSYYSIIVSVIERYSTDDVRYKEERGQED